MPTIVAERYRGLIGSITLEEVSVTVRVGVAQMPAEGMTSADDLVRVADQAMYAAKAAGRNCVRTQST